MMNQRRRFDRNNVLLHLKIRWVPQDSKSQLTLLEIELIIICLQRHRTVEFQQLGHLWNHENMFETGVVRANECYSLRRVRWHNTDIFRFV